MIYSTDRHRQTDRQTELTLMPTQRVKHKTGSKACILKLKQCPGSFPRPTGGGGEAVADPARFHPSQLKPPFDQLNLG